MPDLLGLGGAQPQLTIAEEKSKEVKSLGDLGRVAVATIRTEVIGILFGNILASSLDAGHVAGQVVSNLYHEGVALLESVDDLAPVDHCGRPLASVHSIGWLLLVEAADLLDLLEGGQHPLIIGLELLHTLVQPPGLLLLPVLGAAVVQNLDMGSQSLIHDVRAGITGMSECPEELEHLVRHHAVLVILRQPPDELQQPLSLSSHGTPPAVLETLEQVIQLLRGKVPGQLGQEVMNVLHNSLVFSVLSSPDVIEIGQGERLFLDHEPDHLLQFLHILGLVEVISKHNLDDLILPDPRRHPVRR